MIKEQSNKIQVGDIELNYYRKGSGKDVLILLHGNGEDARIYLDYLNYTANDYTIYAIDLRGHGGSKNNKRSFSIKTMAIDIMRFIHLKPFKAVTIIGYSDGANVAMYLAKIAPELIQKLILISGNLFTKALPNSFINKTKLQYKALKPFSFLCKKVRTKTSILALMLNNIGVYPEDLNKFSFPTLVLDAEDDIIDKNHTALIVKSIPQSKHLTIKQTNHYNIIHNKALFKAIDDFIIE